MLPNVMERREFAESSDLDGPQGEDHVAHVVIVGGGFAGLRVARELGRAGLRVTLVDRENHHLFQPLLYQVATAGLGGPDISAPLRKIVRDQRGTRVLMANVVGIDRKRRIVETDRGQLSYDYLVVAAGATHSYFDHPEWERHAPGLKTLGDAIEIRRRVLNAFELAESASGEAERGPLLTFVIVGAGPTGVELAGAIAEMSRHTLAKEYRSFDPRDTRVLLVERAGHVLPAYPVKLSLAAHRQLERLGVEVRTSASVTHIDAEQVVIDGEVVPCRTTLWAAGVSASPLARALGTSLDQAGRVLVQPHLAIEDDPRVFAVGDIAAVQLGDGGWVPGVAPAATQQGTHAARNIRRQIAGKPMLPFRYRDKGAMATVGRSSAVADVFGLRFAGGLAWLTWLVVHIAFLVGFRNRISVLVDWAWSYLTYHRSARVIIQPQATLAISGGRDMRIRSG